MCRHVTTFGWTVYRGGYCKARIRLAITLFDEEEYLPQKTMEFIFLVLFFLPCNLCFPWQEIKGKKKGDQVNL